MYLRFSIRRQRNLMSLLICLKCTKVSQRLLSYSLSYRSSANGREQCLDSSDRVDELVEPETSYTISSREESQQEVNATEHLGGLKYSSRNEDNLNYSIKRFSLSDYFMGNQHHTLNVLRGFNKQKNKDQRTFVDLKLIRVKSGNGGNGAVSFFRDAFRPVGPPDGGDGGNGGDIYLQAIENITSLHKIKRSYQARDGKSGVGLQLDGKKGEDVIIEIPVGTTVRWIPDPLELKSFLNSSSGNPSNIDLDIKTRDDDVQMFRQSYSAGEGWIFKERDEEYHREKQFFIDLNEQVKEYDQEIIDEELFWDRFPLLGVDFEESTKEPFMLLKGGKGGMGNMHFLTKDIRNPRFSKKGRDGLTEFFLLELKLIADLGLVGLPNAGKSTLLQAISRAHPRIGHWEFTTLQPTVGTIFTSIDKDPFTVADIPGIIKGASQNKGMGLDFLRHVERSGGLVFVVSLHSTDPVSDVQTLLQEVGPKRMQNKRVLVVATKADLNDTGANYSKLKEFADDRNWLIVPVCAPQGHNIDQCINLMSSIAGKSEH
ncbi:uncharacterized protein PRCAT00000458001 [Priceomyces carsonii]|uniref:uncharacterized protein n=1 Tax=Priceomyces carsonii TaxID=28549 RepID=UPI002ED7AF93|nr:unnamed protein product [Priceomyces carsonii]